jgi:hypothetical protein
MSLFKLVVETDPEDITYYKVIRPVLFDEEVEDLLKDEAIYYIQSSQLYGYIVDKVSDGIKVKIPKKLEGSLTRYDLFEGTPDTEVRQINSIGFQDKYINKARNAICSGDIDKNNFIFSFYEFIQLNNYFLIKGIFINNSNRDEKYLEIINMIAENDNEDENDELINNLEKYLELMTKLEQIQDIYKSYLTFVENIKSMSFSSEDVYRNAYNDWVISIGKEELFERKTEE